MLADQGQYGEAIIRFQEARTVFEQLNESVSDIWRNIGTSYMGMSDYDAAEVAYRKSLETDTRLNNRQGQASSLLDLGYLYCYKLNRPEDAVIFYRQGADIAVKLSDLRHEGLIRNNIADALWRLQRYDEAREEIQRAIECKQDLGHADTVWKAFNILHRIETATGNPAASRAAWQQARDFYLAYRQQGGYAQQGGGKLVDNVLEMLAHQQMDEVQSLFAELTNYPEASDSLKQLIQAMMAILNGSRDPALADDPALDFDDAAEVLHFMEQLGSG